MFFQLVFQLFYISEIFQNNTMRGRKLPPAPCNTRMSPELPSLVTGCEAPHSVRLRVFWGHVYTHAIILTSDPGTSS